MAGELKPPRVRPAFRRIAIWVTPVLLFIAAWQIWDAIEARRLDRALAAVVDPRVPTKVVIGGTDDGAGRYYAAASVLTVSLTPRERVRPGPGGPIVDAEILMRDALARGAAPTKDVLDTASRQIEDGRGVFDLLSYASALPFKGFTPGTDFNYRFYGLLDVHRLAGLKTMELAMKGQSDQAARLLLDRLRALRTFDDQRSFTQALKAGQVQTIATDLGILAARAPVTDELLSELDRALSEAYATDALQRAIRGEALGTYQEFRFIWEGRDDRGYPIVGPLLRPALRHHIVLRLQTASDTLAAARLPWPDRISAINRIPARRSIVPEVVQFVAASREAAFVREQAVRLADGIAATRCARLLIAIERYRRTRGTVPEALSDVVSVRDEQTLDPFTGKLLLYSHTGAGYVVYSVGRDLKDEGGKLVADLPRGRLPGMLPAPDVGVRVQRLAPGSLRLAQP